MKRFALLLFVMSVVVAANAIDKQKLVKMGLPQDAVPAKYFFETTNMVDVGANNAGTYDQDDINVSSIWGIDGEYAFFVKPVTSKMDNDFVRIQVWMYSEKTNKVSMVFDQRNSEYEGLLVSAIGMMLDKKPSFKKHVTSDTHSTMNVQEYTDAPVIVLGSEEYNGFSHAPRVTLIILPETKEVNRIDGEQFVSIMHTKTNMLMTAEQDKAQDYILTTSTNVRTEDVPLNGTEDFTIFTKQYLTPVLNIYTATGKLVKSVELLEDEVDMVR